MSEGSGQARIRVLVVDDSPVMRELLVYLLVADPGIQVVGTSSNGEEAIDAVRDKRPDVVAMDYHMPKMNGMEATRKIMESHPVPIVIVSGSSARDEVAAAFRLLEAGALAVVEKPFGIDHPRHEAAARELVQTVKLMAEVKVVRRWPRRETAVAAARLRPATQPRRAQEEMKLVAMGASTGGPVVLKAILSALPKNFPAPILIVQHIATGFTAGLVEWLAQSSAVPVHVAAPGQRLLPGHVYVAPDGFHMKLAKDSTIALGADAPESGHRPSVSHLFRSVAAALGRSAVGVLLTGMGKDGAEELKLMKDAGAVTIAQSEASCVVPGMPGEAIQLGAATYILPPERIAETLATLFPGAARQPDGSD